VNVAEPPRIVVESRASCAESEHAEEVIHTYLGSALAPGHAWTVVMRVAPTPASGHGLRAEGEIYDDLGLEVASRVLSVSSADCAGLARGVGVWASLVLQQEIDRAHKPRPAAPSAQAADSASSDPLWPAPAEPEKAPPERDWFLHHDEGRTLELGVAGFLMTSVGAGPMAGAGPYAIIESGKGVFLRPAIAVGETVTTLNSPPYFDALWVAGRFDTCLRLPGLYTKNHGIQLDLCGGSEVGVIANNTTGSRSPFVSLGPSLDLRGELGGVVAASIRAIGGLTLTSSALGLDSLDQPAGSARLEFAFSWKVK
jgi:hypothetical protein